MKMLSIGLCALLCFPRFAAAAAEPVALVYSLAGEAALTAATGERRPLRLFDRLPAGATLEAGPGSRLALAFANGRRYELGERSKATLGRSDITSRTGPVRALPAIPTLPRILPIAERERPGLRAGAVRIRAERIAGLYPRAGATALAGATVLRFNPVDGAGRYQIEVQDDQGRLVLQTNVESPPVKIPAGTLRPGLAYRWTVRTLARPGSVAFGEADFFTLEKGAARTRARIQEILGAEKPDSLPLLAEIDRGLGLFFESREDLRAALDRSPEDSALRESLAETEVIFEKSTTPNASLRVPSPIPGVPVPSPLFAAAAATREPDEGVVVEDVTSGWAAERAGIRPGDLLQAWSWAGGNAGPVRSPFDLGRLEIEQAPKGAVILRGTREGGHREWVLPPGRWGLKARPTLPEALQTLYERGLNRVGAQDLEAGIGHWRSAVAAADNRQDSVRAAWFQARLARALFGAGRWAEADAAWEAAVQRLEASRPAAAAQLLRDEDWIELLLSRNTLDRVEARLHRAKALEQGESLAAAWDLGLLGRIARERGDYAAAEALLHRADAILEMLAPGSVVRTWTVLLELAKIACRRDEVAAEEEILLEARETLERLSPESLELAAVLGELGRNVSSRGDLTRGEAHLEKALALIERLSPNGRELALISAYLGELSSLRGDLATADERFRRASTLFEELDPDGFYLAVTLNRSALTAEVRGDLGTAREQRHRSLRIMEKLARNTPGMSYQKVYYLLFAALAEKDRGDLAKAEEYLRRTVEWPVGYITADAYLLRAVMAFERGDLARAEFFHRRMLALQEKYFSESVPVSDSLANLGAIELRRGDLSKAENLYRRALAIREKLAPGGARVGLSLNDLGHVDRRAGRLTTAAEHFCRATEVFDRQRTKLGGTFEGRSAFGGTTAEPYRDCIGALVDIGRPEEAFHVLERGRARTFLDLLAKRDLRWTADLPPELSEDRRRTNAEYDRTQAALDRLSPVRDQPEIDRLLVRLRELRARQEEVAAKIRQASPRAAALQDPRPLDLAGARAVLDPGTVLLAWSIGRERSYLFVVQPVGTEPGLGVVRLAVGDQALRERVSAFRNLLQSAGSARTELSRQARELYDSLLRPAEPWIASAERILVSPDGPLHTLPFAALMRDGRWLAEQKPTHTVLSATVYAELKRSRRPGSEEGAVLAAFGDPSYPPLPAGQSPSGHSEVRAALGRGLTLTALPSTREEVRGIAAFYPEAKTFLGADATEERAKSIGKDARYLHFACHGLLDERFPLNSGLALTIPERLGEGQDNGLLQAWEIIDSILLDADLVTLSACDTALGKEMGGEGLIGLTRAFQYAGARAVLASLWGVADTSTTELMKRFYGYLRGGRSQDEALQAAQVDLIRSPTFSHPYHWAAFQLAGDWQ